jgi:hypothetical protein
MDARIRPFVLAVLVVALTAIVLIARGAAAAPQPLSLECEPGQITWLSGAASPRTPLLIWWQGRAVGGGSIDSAGHWALPLNVGKERPGIYAVEVRSRGENALIGAFRCAVGVAAGATTPAPIQLVPTAAIVPATPTQPPINTGSEDVYNCDDFTTWQEAYAVFQASPPGDPNKLDTDFDGIPCEDLPGAPTQLAPTEMATIAPTPTPQTIVSVPLPTGACAINAPAAVEGAQAWVTYPAPTENTNEIVCVRLIVNGQVVSGAPATITVHYKTTDTEYTGTTGDDGVAQIVFDISRATSGFTVVVDASVGGQTAQTSFTTQ